MTAVYLFAAGLLAGAVNAVAGGGPLLTLAALTGLGFDPRIANLSSTVALSPGQIFAGWSARSRLLSLRERGQDLPSAFAVSLAGGAVGAGFLLVTDGAQFRAIVPWLVILATGIYAWSGRARPAIERERRMPRPLFLTALGISAIYGGYFGGGNSFVVLALLATSGLADEAGGAVKNALIAAMNLGAVALFVMSGEIDWPTVAVVGMGGLVGSAIGVRLLSRFDPAVFRHFIILCGVLLAAWFFVN